MDIIQSDIVIDKVCCWCGVLKPASCFYLSNQNSDHLWSCCKECSNIRARDWRRKNVELNRKRRKAYMDANPDKVRQWRARNPDKIREWTRKAQSSNPAKYAEYTRIRDHRKRGNGGSFTQDEWEALCTKFGNVCVACGKRRKLTVDHVIPVTKGGTSDISNIQPLCNSCNSRKSDCIIDYRPDNHGN